MRRSAPAVPGRSGTRPPRDAIAMRAWCFAPSRDDLAGLEELFRSERIVHLPPFLDAATVSRRAEGTRGTSRPASRGERGLDPAVPWIVVAAMMRPGDKVASYRALADALSRLADLPWRLVVAGDGSGRAEVEAALERAVPGRACFPRHAGSAAARRDVRRLRPLRLAGGERGLRHVAPRSAGGRPAGGLARHARRARRGHRRTHRRPGEGRMRAADALRALLLDPIGAARSGAAAAFVPQKAQPRRGGQRLGKSLSLAL